MDRTEVRAVEDEAANQHHAYEEACLHGRDTEAEVHWGMELGLRLAIKRAKQAANAKRHARNVAARAKRKRERRAP